MFSIKLPKLPTSATQPVITVPGVAELVNPPGKALANMASTFGSTLNSLAASAPNPALPAGIKNPFSGLMGTTSIFSKKINTVNMAAAGAWAPPLRVTSPSASSVLHILQPVSAQGARGSL